MKKKYTNTGIMDLMRLSYPVTAIVSIMHRISGIITFIYIPALAYILGMSLSGECGYRRAIEYSKSFIIYPLVFAALLHLFAGIRHLIMDIGLFENRTSGKITALVTILSSILFTLGIYLHENF